MYCQSLYTLNFTLCLLFWEDDGTSQILLPTWIQLMAASFETQKGSRSWPVIVKDKQGHLVNLKQRFLTPSFPCTLPGLPAHSSFGTSPGH